MRSLLCWLDLDERRKQITASGPQHFPIQAFYNDLAQMPEQKVAWHWHEEVEVLYIARGSAIVRVEEKTYAVTEGDGLFLNTNVLHSITQHQENCVFYSFVFSPQLISGANDSVFETSYVTPVLESTNIPCVIFSHQESYGQAGADCILAAFEAYEQGELGYELIIRSQLTKLWYLIVTTYLKNHQTQEENNVMKRTKAMMTYIHEHYQEPLTLQMIAKSANISSREALRCFQKTIDDSPISYLLTYRISQAANALIHTNLSITEICTKCGFEDASYFAKVFKKTLNESPRDYRKHKQMKK